MRRIFQAVIIAFSMYSTIPMPRVDWEEDNMQYAMCFLPFVGVIVGALLTLWARLSLLWDLGPGLFAAVALAIPLMISGGIHMDGFCDTVDALSSHQTRERMLEILKDSHIGAFALIGCLTYFVLSYGLWTEFYKYRFLMPTLGMAYAFSRCLGAISVVTFPCAKRTGTVATFASRADRDRARLVLAVFAVLNGGAMIWASPVCGAACIGIALLTFGWYYWFAKKTFGGITGDIAGFFVQSSELLMLAAAVVTGGML